MGVDLSGEFGDPGHGVASRHGKAVGVSVRVASVDSALYRGRVAVQAMCALWQGRRAGHASPVRRAELSQFGIRVAMPSRNSAMRVPTWRMPTVFSKPSR